MAGSLETQRPTVVRTLWEWWKRVAIRIGHLQTRGLLVVFYFVVLGPVSLAVRSVSDPLAIKPNAPRGWRPRGSREDVPIERARRQF